MRYFPGLLGEVAKAAGEEAALAMAKDHGGTEVSIPVRPEADHWLSDLIGHPEATAVAAAIALKVGLRINVPFGPIRMPESDNADYCPADSLGSEVLDDIAQVIGSDATFALAVEFAGERLYIPKVREMQPRIEEAIGPDLADSLCNMFWRSTIPFPMKPIIERQVVILAERGLTKCSIATRLKIRQARVFEILRRHRQPAAI